MTRVWVTECRDFWSRKGHRCTIHRQSYLSHLPVAIPGEPQVPCWVYLEQSHFHPKVKMLKSPDPEAPHTNSLSILPAFSQSLLSPTQASQPQQEGSESNSWATRDGEVKLNIISILVVLHGRQMISLSDFIDIKNEWRQNKPVAHHKGTAMDWTSHSLSIPTETGLGERSQISTRLHCPAPNHIAGPEGYHGNWYWRPEKSKMDTLGPSQSCLRSSATNLFLSQKWVWTLAGYSVTISNRNDILHLCLH